MKLPEDKNLGSVNKQLLLSELFNKSKSEFDKQPQNMSGLLNLNKQQQEMLANSKQVNEQFTKADFPPIQKLKTVDRMEAARKEYELAMFALQQKQEQEAAAAAAAAAAARRFQGICEPDLNQFEYEKRLNLQQQQQQQQPQMFVQVNQPLINMGSFGFKYPQMFVPWQEPEQPPMPPSWWSEPPQNRQPQQVRNL